MEQERSLSPAGIEAYLVARPRRLRWLEWLSGRRYRVSKFSDRSTPLVVTAHQARDAGRAREFSVAIEQDWALTPPECREAYDEILFRAPGLVIVQLRRKNLCGCLGHRHVIVKEAPFAEPHEAFAGAGVGELDIAYDRIGGWQSLPLSDIALDARFLEGSRLEDFHARQFRLRALSVLLHEIHHLVFPQESESAVRARSLKFYHDALASYVERTSATLSFTIDRSFSRLG